MIPSDQCLMFKGEEPSKGEKLYDKAVYSWMNYWLNLGMSLVITDLFAHGRGKPMFDRGVKRATKGLMSTGLFKEDYAEWFSRIGLGTFSLNSGGNILVVPLKILEDNKRNVVHWINKNIYKDPQLAPDGHEETPLQIHIAKEIPKQSWWNVIRRRLLAWGATTGVGLALDSTFKKKLDVPTINEKGQEVVYTYGQDRMAKGIVDAMKNLPFGEKLLSYPWINRYAFYASLDSAYTWITSTIMEKTSPGGKGKMPQEIGDEHAPAVVDDRLDALHYADAPVAKARDELKSRKYTATASHTQQAARNNEAQMAMTT